MCPVAATRAAVRGIPERRSKTARRSAESPFLNPGEDRRPTLTFPRHIPLDEEPGDTFIEINKNAEFHKNSNIPKLFINADPGFLLVGSQRDEVREWNNLKEVTVKGNHFIQEDSPDEITVHIKDFINDL